MAGRSGGGDGPPKQPEVPGRTPTPAAAPSRFRQPGAAAESGGRNGRPAATPSSSSSGRPSPFQPTKPRSTGLRSRPPSPSGAQQPAAPRGEATTASLSASAEVRPAGQTGSAVVTASAMVGARPGPTPPPAPAVNDPQGAGVAGDVVTAPAEEESGTNIRAPVETGIQGASAAPLVTRGAAGEPDRTQGAAPRGPASRMSETDTDPLNEVATARVEASARVGGRPDAAPPRRDGRGAGDSTATDPAAGPSSANVAAVVGTAQVGRDSAGVSLHATAATASAAVPRVRALEIPRSTTAAQVRAPVATPAGTRTAPAVDPGAVPSGQQPSNQASNTRAAPAVDAGAAQGEPAPAGSRASSGNAADEFGSFVPVVRDDRVWDFRELGARKTRISEVMDALPGFRPALEGFANNAGNVTYLRTILQRVAGQIRSSRPRRGIRGGAAGRTGARLQTRVRELEETERRLRDAVRDLERARADDREALREERQHARHERARANDAEAHAHRLQEEIRHLRGRGVVRPREDDFGGDDRPPRRPRHGDYEHGQYGHGHGWYGGGGGPGPSGGAGGMAA